MKKILSSLLAASFVVTNLGISTITASASEETTFTAVVNIYNEETKDSVKGIDVKFVEFDADLPTIPEPQANIVRVLSEWNTSDTNPYEIADIDFVKGHFYAVQIDNIPEGYCYSWEDHVITGIHGNGTLTGIVNYNIALQPHNPLPKVEYPLDIERNFTFSVVDKSTNQVIEGLDVELARMELDANVVNKYNYVETVDSWNTAADSYAITIPITYDVYDCPSAVFGIKINNMPEGYTYYQPAEDGYTVCGYYGAYDYRYDLYKGNDTTECIAYIYPEDKPHVYTSTKISDKSTTTTTTTTTVVTDPTAKGTIQLTLNDVIELSKKGNDLTWDDFKDYISTDIGSGLYIEKYDLEEGYTLLVGGVPSEKPYYIDLYRYDDTKNSIDIRTEDVAAFLDSTATMTTTAAETTTVATTTTTAILTDAQGRLVDENGEVIIINGTSAVMTMPTTTTTTTTVSNELYFNSQYDYVPVEVGLNTGVELAGFDDGKFYEVGDSPIEFTIDDEKIAKVGVVQGIGVNVLGVSVGETVLNAKAPDGRTASIKVVVKEAPSTSTTAVWNEVTTTTTTTADTNSDSSGDSQLPQTGYSDIYKVIAGLAVLMTVGGAALVVKTRKENE